MFIRAQLTYTTEIALSSDGGVTSLVLVPLPYVDGGAEDIGPHLLGTFLGSTKLVAQQDKVVKFQVPIVDEDSTEPAPSPSPFSSPLSSITESEDTDVEEIGASSPSHGDQVVYQQGNWRKIYNMDSNYATFQSSGLASIQCPPPLPTGMNIPEDSLYAHVYDHPHRSEKLVQLWIYSAQARQWNSAMKGLKQNFNGKPYRLEWKSSYGPSWIRK